MVIASEYTTTPPKELSRVRRREALAARKKCGSGWGERSEMKRKRKRERDARREERTETYLEANVTLL
jgi:hypothetical protein